MTAYPKGTPARFDLTEVDWDQSGAAQNADAATEGLTLNRIEDGAFDPQHPNDFWFVTTAGGAGAGSGGGGGLWKVTFDDRENPDAGGTLTLMLDGTEGLFSPDNMAIDTHGNLLIQEDPGNNAHRARLMAYRIADGALAPVAQFDAALFTSGAPGFITQDEESSGIIDAEAVYGAGRNLPARRPDPRGSGEQRRGVCRARAVLQARDRRLVFCLRQLIVTSARPSRSVGGPTHAHAPSPDAQGSAPTRLRIRHHRGQAVRVQAERPDPT